LKYVDKHADLKAGDLIVTSGLDGVFPAGLPVGVVERVVKEAPGYFQEVRVRPSADLMHNEEVMVIDYGPQGAG